MLLLRLILSNPNPNSNSNGSVASNRLDTADYLESLYARGAELVRACAYVHWYEKYGTSRTEIENAMEEVRGTADDYRDVHKQQ